MYSCCHVLAAFFSSVHFDFTVRLCFQQNGSGCGYVQWYDPPLSKFLSELIGDLRDEVWRLRSEEHVPVTEEHRGREEAVQALQYQVKEKDAEITAIRARYDRRQMLMMYTNVIFGIFIFVSGVVTGMILMR
jgi:hypothetical protein